MQHALQLLLTIGYTALFAFAIQKISFFKTKFISIQWLQTIFVLKVICGCLLGLIYTYYYTDRSTADTFKFFDDSKILFDALKEKPYDFFRMLTGYHSGDADLLSYYEKMSTWLNSDILFNDNKTIVRVNTIFHFFSLGFYFVHVVFINIITFSGLFALYKLMMQRRTHQPLLMLMIVFFLPGMMFWGSGLLKDGLLIAALGILLYSFNELMQNASGKILFVFIMAFLMMLFVKLYFLLAIIPGLIAWLWNVKSKKINLWLKFISTYAIAFFIAFNIHVLIPKYKIVDILFYKQRNFYELATNTNAKSVIDIPLIDASPWSIILHSPQAIANVLFRPLPWEAESFFITLAAFENIIILLVIMYCIMQWRKQKFVMDEFYLLLLFVTIIMFALIGMITPVLGALVRYKVPLLPFFLFLFSGKEKSKALT